MIEILTYADYMLIWGMGIVGGMGFGSILYIIGLTIGFIYNLIKRG